ncbi:sigma-54 dependent transcriptional regulator [Desulfoferula mesophila]|uniref:Acetoacetate metabolism regulatory protein AtoC n=1 Tax=Desulfoferula mesophila TaxID=3058419 RepID=A0AAU9ERC0_9BACT|nr:acetoacetate metabolism regulatory protein AtoC [Desulfoferula mesophilus]
MAANPPIALLQVSGDKARGRAMQKWLQGRDVEVSLAAGAQEALALADQSYFDLALLSDPLGGEPVAPLLERFTQLFPATVVTVFSDRPQAREAVSALRRGAFDYVATPRNREELWAVVEAALEHRNHRLRPPAQARPAPPAYDVQHLMGQSRAIQQVFRLILKVAPSDSTVLILGESGTGKELVARAIHHHSPRRDAPLVSVNCGAIPGELLESELFGHERGAFTGAVRSRVGRFELAQGGTIFLDEIGDLPPHLQVKILRVLQEHAFERVGGTRTIQVDLRVVAATNQDLAAQVAAGEFREDLYYRLNVVPITVPPLRQRRSDIPLLGRFFLERLHREKGLGPKTLHPEAAERLLRYDWPGNVRELENLLERLVVLAEGEVIGPEDLPPSLGRERLLAPEAPPPAELPPGGLDLKETLGQVERRLIAQALAQSGGVKAQAAALLGLNRTTLVQKLKKMGGPPPGGADPGDN